MIAFEKFVIVWRPCDLYGMTISRGIQAKSKESREIGWLCDLIFEYAKFVMRNCRYGAQTDDMCGTIHTIGNTEIVRYVIYHQMSLLLRLDFSIL